MLLIWFIYFLEVEVLNSLQLTNLVAKLALCTAALLPELKPAPCFLSDIIGQTFINSGVSDYCCRDY